jgi:hypothetical protein
MILCIEESRRRLPVLGESLRLFLIPFRFLLLTLLAASLSFDRVRNQRTRNKNKTFTLPGSDAEQATASSRKGYYLFLPLLQFFRPQFFAQYFTHGGLGQFFAEFNFRRQLVGSQMSLAIFDHFLRRSRLAFLENDK